MFASNRAAQRSRSICFDLIKLSYVPINMIKISTFSNKKSFRHFKWFKRKKTLIFLTHIPRLKTRHVSRLSPTRFNGRNLNSESLLLKVSRLQKKQPNSESSCPPPLTVWLLIYELSWKELVDKTDNKNKT